VNVLKPYLENTVITLLKKGLQQRQINRKTGVDRKTIRRIRRQLAAAAAAANSSTLATGSGPPGVAENPPPWPPAATAVGAPIPPPVVPAYARSACEGHREWIEAQVRLGRNAMAIYQELVDTPYIPHMSATITREFLSADQARKARSGTPSRSRV
jgi:hypothetical protein